MTLLGRVLVVDDNDDVRRLLALALSTAGLEVVEAGTRHDARQQLRTPPDALVLDFQRAETDGLVLLRELRARPDLARLPVVFLAAGGDDDDDLRWTAMRAGADWFGRRPLGMLDLRTHVIRLVTAGRPRLRPIGGQLSRPLPRMPLPVAGWGRSGRGERLT